MISHRREIRKIKEYGIALSKNSMNVKEGKSRAPYQIRLTEELELRVPKLKDKFRSVGG